MKRRTWCVLVSLGVLGAAGAGVARGAVLLAVGSGVGDGSSNVYRIDDYATAPVAVGIGEAGRILSDLAVDPKSGRAYALGYDPASTTTPVMLFDLNLATGAATNPRATGEAGLNALEFDAAGRCYAWGAGRVLVRLDPSTGAATRVGATGAEYGAGDLAFDADGRLYGTSVGNSLVRLDPGTGAATTVNGAFPSNAFGLEIDPDGRMFAGVGSVTAGSMGKADLFRVDTATGAATLIGPVAGAAGFGLYGLSFTEAAVPEPTAAAAALVLLASLVPVRNRSRGRRG